MVIRLSRQFLKKFFSYLYYCILPEYKLWDEKVPLILEPICTIQTRGNILTDCCYLDELMTPSYNTTKLRSIIKNEVDQADPSSIEQVFFPLKNKVAILNDNPLIFPGNRLEYFMTDWLNKNPDTAKLIDGICHFHPCNYEPLNEDDIRTMKNVIQVMKKLGHESMLGLVIAKDNPEEYIERSRSHLNEFIRFMMADLKNTLFDGEIFYADGRSEDVDFENNSKC